MMIKGIAKLIAFLIINPIFTIVESVKSELNYINNTTDDKNSVSYISKDVDVPPVNKYGSTLSKIS